MNIQTTHVGSLPYSDVEAAIDYTFKFDIPVLFSLPNLGAEHFMGSDILSYSRGWENFNSHSLDNLFFEKEFFNAFNKQQKKQFKVQLIGPVTLHKYFLKEREYAEVESKLISAYVRLIGRLSHRGDLFFVLDEPALNQKVDIERFNNFSNELCSGSTSIIGVHCCGKLDLDLYDDISLEFKQLDWSLYKVEQIPKKGRFFGGFEKFDHEICQKLSFQADNIIISPSCGLYLHSNPEEIFEQLKTVKNILKKSKII